MKAKDQALSTESRNTPSVILNVCEGSERDSSAAPQNDSSDGYEGEMVRDA